MFAAGLKGGIIVGVMIFLLALASLIPIPFLPLCTLLVTLILWAGAGVLAVRYGGFTRFGQGVGTGIIAGAVSQVIGGIGAMLAGALSAILFPEGRVSFWLPPAALRQLAQAGVDPRLLMGADPLGALLVSFVCCCLGGVVVAALFGAIGGAIAAAFQPKTLT